MLKRGVKIGVPIDPGEVQDLIEDWTKGLTGALRRLPDDFLAEWSSSQHSVMDLVKWLRQQVGAITENPKPLNAGNAAGTQQTGAEIRKPVHYPLAVRTEDEASIRGELEKPKL